MPNAADILWFKEQFQASIEPALRNTPFSVDLITAVACQETGSIWQVLRRKGLDTARVLELCVGDTLDESGGRKAFPRTRTALLAKPGGERMFALARQALLDMAAVVPGYSAVAGNPDKFCHGFGIFQYDLQFFLVDPDYFLLKRYANFGVCLERCVGELRNAMKRIGWQDKTALTDYEMACVTIAYNTGGFRPDRGLKQGHKDDDVYYGEQIFEFLRMSKTVALPGAGPAPLPAPAPGTATVPPPTPVASTGQLYEVEVLESTLRLRREPRTDPAKPNDNVIARLPDGHRVRAVTDRELNGFLEVETSLLGAHLRGYASAQYLKRVPGANTAPAADAIPVPPPAPPATGVVAVYMPRRPGTVTGRTQAAGAHSLNEPDQPVRRGTTAQELRRELAAIIDWLAVDNEAHLRYQPRDGMTFCNIYAHDYCHLAGVYLPRVWWSSAAIEALARGQDVEPRYGATIDEQRANSLFGWLRDYGPRFGWRQTGTLSKLQQEANQGAIGLIVARRRDDGRPGHLVVVAPETDARRARRDAAGEVIAPLQSQAGASNFRYGTGKLDWWRAEQFADSAYWLHA